MNVSFYSVQLVKEKETEYEVLRGYKINSPTAANDFIRKVTHLDKQPRESLIMAALDIKFNVIGVHTVYVGTLNACYFQPREILQLALLNNAYGIMLFHNHPSGNPEPSQEDDSVTNRLERAAKIIGIDFIDHIIVGSDNRYYSYKEDGKL